MARKKKPADSPSNQLAGIYPPGKMKLVQQAPEQLTIGERLRRERVLRKMTMEELADYLGISPAYLGAVERGQRPLSNRLMKRLHDRLGISYDYLLEGITISGNMISQFVRESEIYTTNRNLNILLNVCTEDELDSCYNLVHTYLKFIREKGPTPERSGKRKSGSASVRTAAPDRDPDLESGNPPE